MRTGQHDRRDELLDRGLQLFNRGRDRFAAVFLHRAAGLGSIEAVGALSMLYASVDSPIHDASLAQHWSDRYVFLLHAHAQVDPECKLKLSMVFRNGARLARNEPKALRLLQEAATEGSPSAEYLLAVQHRFGWMGAEHDVGLWRMWIERAVAQGHPEATFDLGRHVFEFEDSEAGRVLIEKAASLGIDAAIDYLKSAR